MSTLREIRFATIDGVLECTKGDLGEPESYESIAERAGTQLCIGCRRLGIEFVAEFGGLGKPQVPDELAVQLIGKTYQEGMLVDYQGEPCVVTGLSLMPPRGWIENEDNWLQLGNYLAAVGQEIPGDSRVISLSLIRAADIDLEDRRSPSKPGV